MENELSELVKRHKDHNDGVLAVKSLGDEIDDAEETLSAPATKIQNKEGGETSRLFGSIKETTPVAYKQETQRTSNIPSDNNAPSSTYAGDYIDNTPEPPGGYKTAGEVDAALNFPHPFRLVCFFDPDVISGHTTIYPWQRDVLLDFGHRKGTIAKPHKHVVLASNGSGKDKYIIAPFAIWFTLCKVRSRVIITTASGTQLTSQTEPYIKDLAEKVNNYFGQEVFRIRQRYIKCMLTGSEIRMFATDESGKAEGYHPIDARAEMAIIVNEGKSVTEDIHRALRRCTGYNYWLEISSAGEPKGFLYKAFTDLRLSFNSHRITSYDCPHIPVEDIEQDKVLDGENSAFFRSKHLSLFTSIGGEIVIEIELINDCIANPPQYSLFGNKWARRIGLDLAAGGDENAIVETIGNKCVFEDGFRDTNTVNAASRINDILLKRKVPKNHPHIYADDGGVGRSIIDMLVNIYGWNIQRIMNQWPALGNKKQYGNRGAENWYRCKRIIEEKCFDISSLSEKCREQLSNRHYKKTLTGGRIFLMQKKEEIAEGNVSPDRADAFILSLTGLTVEDFISATDKAALPVADSRNKQQFKTPQEVEEHWENTETYAEYEKNQKEGKRIFGSLTAAMRN